MSSLRPGSEVSAVLAEPLFLVEVLVLAGLETETFVVMTVSTILAFCTAVILPSDMPPFPFFPFGSGS